jgi:hypothetical protein
LLTGLSISDASVLTEEKVRQLDHAEQNRSRNGSVPVEKVRGWEKSYQSRGRGWKNIVLGDSAGLARKYGGRGTVNFQPSRSVQRKQKRQPRRRAFSDENRLLLSHFSPRLLKLGRLYVRLFRNDGTDWTDGVRRRAAWVRRVGELRSSAWPVGLNRPEPERVIGGVFTPPSIVPLSTRKSESVS